MATNTTRLSLIKPDYVDVVDVEDLNSNADAIDAAVGFTICTSATRPTSPYTGQAIFETDTLTGFTWDGSAWQVTSGASTTTADTAPSSPKVGDLWWDSTDGSLYVWYEDVDGSQWVGIRAASSSASIDVDDVEPGSPLTGNLWWNTDAESGKSLNVYNGSSWVNAQPLSNNAIINGDFGVWQRGTSANLGGGFIAADRWRFYYVTAIPVGTLSRQSFSAGDIEATGFGDAEYFSRIDVTDNNGCTNHLFSQLIEDVRVFAGQTATLSFWAKADSNLTVQTRLAQIFGSGGSGAVTTTYVSNSVTTSWQRFTVAIELPSVSGKTIGSSSSLRLDFNLPLAIHTLDLWGVQLEAGSVATPFRLAGGGSKGAELALCQRYYERINVPASSYLVVGIAPTTTNIFAPIRFSEKRVAPSVDLGTVGNWTLSNGVANYALTAESFAFTGTQTTRGDFDVASGLTTGSPYFLRSTGDYIEFDAEL